MGTLDAVRCWLEDLWDPAQGLSNTGGLASVLASCLAEEPSERPSAADLLLALAPFAHGSLDACVGRNVVFTTSGETRFD